jgi:hypothetical protein
MINKKHAFKNVAIQAFHLIQREASISLNVTKKADKQKILLVFICKNKTNK